MAWSQRVEPSADPNDPLQLDPVHTTDVPRKKGECVYSWYVPLHILDTSMYFLIH